MPDIRDLLLSSGRLPLDAVDPGLVARRARALRRRQLALQSVAAVGTLAVAVPVGLSLTDAEPVSLQPLPGASRTAAVPSGAPPAVAVHPAPTALASPSLRVLPASPVPLAPRPSASADPRATSAADPAYPRRGGCQVDSSGLLPGQSRSCRFTSSAGGGWRLHVRGGAGMSELGWEVAVERDGVVMVNPGDTGASCANNALESGDRVTVTVTQESQGLSDVYLGAGDAYWCGAR